MKHLAVLLTVFNRKEQTLRCLKNLFKQQLPDGYALMVYLTNDGCTDGTPEAIREQFPQVIIIDGDGSLFWNRGMWKAWDYASKEQDHDFYLWLNDDTFLYPNAIKELISSSENKKHKAIIVGPTESVDKTHATYGGRDRSERLLPVDGMEKNCPTFNGNIVLCPKYVFHILGNLDPFYHHSAGDTDYGYSATKKGIPVIQLSHFIGACNEHPTIKDWCNPKVPIRKRWKALHRPNGQPPRELFHLESKFFGIHTASFHYLTTYIHCLIPQIWIYLGKQQKK